ESNWRGQNNLICNECNTKLEQKYICSCGKQYRIGEIEKRFDKDTKTVFFKSEYDTFLKNETPKEIVVVGKPIPYSIFNKLYEELKEDSKLELFNNEDRFQPVLARMKETLFVKDLCFIAKMGYSKKMRTVLIVGTARKLLAIPLRDMRLVRPTNQVGSKVLVKNEQLDKRVEELTRNENIDKYYEFIKLKKQGKKIEVKEEKKIEIPSNVDMTMLDELEKPKKIAVKVA
ncbi:MAG: hypothetical protein ACE5K4_11005, partial [Candidatus Hydrothermarchaeota archaeon]